MKDQSENKIWLIFLLPKNNRKIDKTNISYIESHRVIIKDTTFLLFNYSSKRYDQNHFANLQIIKMEVTEQNRVALYYIIT